MGRIEDKVLKKHPLPIRAVILCSCGERFKTLKEYEKHMREVLE